MRKLAAETELAKQEAAASKAIADEAAKEAEKVAEETAEKLKIADQMISQMREAVEASRRRENVAVANLNRISTDRMASFGSIARETNPQLSSSTEELAFSVYPNESGSIIITNTPTGVLLNRTAAEVFKKALIETSSRREAEKQYLQVIDERGEQIKRLEEVIAQKDVSLEALSGRITALENQVVTLTASYEANNRVIEKLEKELEAEKRKNFWNKWYGRIFTVAGFTAGLLIGGAI